MNQIDYYDPDLAWGGVSRETGQLFDLDDFDYVIALNGAPRYHVPIGKFVVVAPIDDGYKIPNVELLHKLADMVNEFSAKGPTLVHCSMGINRSSLVVALALIKRGGNPREVVKRMRQLRGSDVLCNEVFEEWLYEFSCSEVLQDNPQGELARDT